MEGDDVKFSPNVPETLTPMTSELRVRIDEEEDTKDKEQRLKFSSPLASSVCEIVIDECEPKEDDKEKKKSRKSVDESGRKRKDTTTSSFTHFIHRIGLGKLWFDDHKKDEKHKSDTDTDRHESPTRDTATPFDRPDQLDIPDKPEQWFESHMTADFQTAVDPGSGKFWEEINEIDVPHLEPPKAIIRSERDSELDEQERSLVGLLEEFRSGRMRALDDDQVHAMREMKQAHEDITQLHLRLYGDDFKALDNEEGDSDQFYEQISQKLYNMHFVDFNPPTTPTS